MTTRVTVPHFDDILGGEDTTSPPHMLRGTVWRRMENVRIFGGCLMTVGAPVHRTTFTPASTFTMRLRNAYGGNAQLLVIGPTWLGLSLLPYGDFVPYETVEGQPLYFKTPPEHLLPTCDWAVEEFESNFYFTNEVNPLLYTDGSYIHKLPGPAPSGRYLIKFYEHLFVGCYTYRETYYPCCVKWSNLGNPFDWEPKVENESDYFDFSEFGSIVTGLHRLGDKLVVMTDKNIMLLDYVGLPKIVQVYTFPAGLGSSFARGSVTAANSVYFYNEDEQDFLRFSLEGGVERIGEPIRSFYLETRNSKLLHALVMQERRECLWFYPHINSNYYTAVAFNWSTGRWYHFTGLPFFREVFTARREGERRILSLLESYSSFPTTSIMQMGSSQMYYDNVYGIEAFGKIYVWDSYNATYAESMTGKLETGDLAYGDPDSVKETDTIVLYGQGTSGSLVKVFLSAKYHLHEPDTFVQVGQWQPATEEGRITFPKMRGRWFRWRFLLETPTTTDFIRLYGFIEHIYGIKAEK